MKTAVKDKASVIGGAQQWGFQINQSNCIGVFIGLVELIRTARPKFAGAARCCLYAANPLEVDGTPRNQLMNLNGINSILLSWLQ